MLFIDRVDGRRIRDPGPFHAILPFLMRGRNESAVYYSKDIDVDSAVRYVHRRNAESGERTFTLFGLILTAAAQTFVLKPRLNRFVHGRSLYERKDIKFSFIVKKRLTEDAKETTAQVTFPPDVTVDSAADIISRAVELARGQDLTPDEREASIIHRIPFGKFIVSRLFRLLDRFNVAPRFMLASDPLYSSAFFANLGSIGLDTPFHHLYEWGTASLFVVVGRLFQQESRGPDGVYRKKNYVNVKMTLDERIADGLYFARAAALFQRLVQHPERMERPPDDREAESGGKPSGTDAVYL